MSILEQDCVRFIVMHVYQFLAFNQTCLFVCYAGYFIQLNKISLTLGAPQNTMYI